MKLHDGSQLVRRWLAVFSPCILLLVISAGWQTGCMKVPLGLTPLPAGVQGGTASGFAGGTPRLRAALPGAVPGADEEVWVIARDTSVTAVSTNEMPGGGSLLTEINDRKVAVPLRHTDVKAAIDGYIASVRVTQQFHNPYDAKIEAVYVFPLPENAAVNEFVMTIGERRIRGIIRAREDAEKVYREAKAQGYTAALLTQERPNIFTQAIANIEPGHAIGVTITYFHTLTYADGSYEFVFPMVVGPRFNPPGFEEGIGAVGRGAAGRSGQPTEVTYLRPGERNGHDIAVAVEVNAGVSIEEISSRSHKITPSAIAPGHTLVQLDPADRIPNKDFVLRYRVAGARVKSNLITGRDDRGGYFTLMLFPPQDLSQLKRQPLELVFVLDCSGSMSGRPLRQAKAAIARALQRLQPGDSFQLINFSMNSRQLGPAPLEATAANRQRGLTYLRSLDSEGGTMMIEGIKAALDFPHDPERLRFVCFLTDGFIGNDDDILREAQDRLGASRIFSFGVGSSPNRSLLHQLAKLGRGVAAYLGSDDEGARVMDEFFDRISHPALTDVRVDWGGLKVEDVFPRVVPDLFVGRPVVVTGRYAGVAPAILRVAGRAEGRAVKFEVAANPGRRHESPRALPSVWARMKVADLADEARRGQDRDLASQIRQLALDYSLMSAYTAFVAVDASRRTEGRTGTTVPVAVPVPKGVKYDTTVEE